MVTLQHMRQTLTTTSHQMDLIDIYRIFHTKAAEYTFFFSSSTYETFCRTDHILGHKPSLGKINKTGIV